MKIGLGQKITYAGEQLNVKCNQSSFSIHQRVFQYSSMCVHENEVIQTLPSVPLIQDREKKL